MRMIVSLCRRSVAILLPLVLCWISVDCQEASSSPRNELNPSLSSLLRSKSLSKVSNLNSTTSTSTSTTNPSLSFPLVYSALVPRPGVAEDEIHLLSEVDLLHIDQQDCNKDRSKCRIYFLVHSAKEFSFLSSFPQSLTHEPGKTRAFLDPPVHDTRILQSSVYSTIANFPCYNDLQGSLAWMRDLLQTSTIIPNLQVSRIDIGDSFLKTQDQTKGYDIYALNITGKSNIFNGSKSVMLAMSGIHPREYAPPELLQRWATQLVEGYGVDADITAILDHAEIHLVIQLNPDGRALAETTQPWRRKNLNEASAQSCQEDETGVDLNRNFPFQWGLTSGSSSRPCAQTHRGRSAASEPEIQALVNYALSIFPTPQRQTVTSANPIAAYPTKTTSGIFIDVHSYGELIIWPWGYQNAKSPNHVDLQALVNKYIQFNDYTSSGPDENFGYVASGASDDWFYATLGAAGVTFELGDAFRQNCNYFEDSILPGNLKALTYAAKVSSKPYSLPKGPDIVSMIVIQEQVVNLPGAFVTVALDVSDNLLASSQALDSTQQTVTAVRIYVDLHPYDDSGNTGPLVTLTGSQLQVGVSSEGSPTTLGVATIVLDQLLDTRPGRHAIYVEAVDSDETVGPVTAAWFEILPPPPTKVPTKSPTAEPSDLPSIVPFPSPSNSPTASPSSLPSALPSNGPSSSPSNLPTTSPSLLPSDLHSNDPSSSPSNLPTTSPSLLPSDLPSNGPSSSPSNVPTPEEPDCIEVDGSICDGVSFDSSTFDKDSSSCHISTNHIPLMLLSSAALGMVLL